MELHKIKSYAEFKQFETAHEYELKALHQLEASLQERFEQSGPFHYPGISWPLGQSSQFLVDGKYPQTDSVNFRERLVCKKTKLNNRIRGAIHVFEQLFNPPKAAKLYLTEQHTALYKWFKKRYTAAVGSEYLIDSHWFNRFKFRVRLFPEPLNHQDLTALSYTDEYFDYVLSFDCFEHIPEYQAAFVETHRVLKPGGQLMFSVPFDFNSPSTLVRASINQQGEVKHHVTPEYHGNPISRKGSLSFYTFGWDLLESLKTAGFKQAYGVIYWSEQYAYLGGLQLMICAEK